MKFAYYPETDTLYLELSDALGADSRPAGEDVVLDYDAGGRLGGIDLDHATRHADAASVNDLVTELTAA